MPLQHPLQKLALSPSGRLLGVACGSELRIVDIDSCKVIARSNAADSHKQGCFIRHIVWHSDSKFLTNAEDKVVKEWTISISNASEELTLDQQIVLPKRANALSITEDGQTIVIADKFGDVYCYPMAGQEADLPQPPMTTFAPEASTSATPTAEPSVEPSQSGPSDGKKAGSKRRKMGNTNGVTPEWRHVPARVAEKVPVLGHVSLLTAMLVLSKEGKIITADRDEHVRVSQWPRCWEIERFLLGQRKFVSALAMLPDQNILVSAGGDDTLRLWNLDDYSCLRKDVSVEPLKGTAEVVITFEPQKLGKRYQQKQNRKAQTAALKHDEAQPKSHEATGQIQEEDVDLPQTRVKGKTKKLDLGVNQIAFLKSKQDGSHYMVLSSVGSSALLVYSTSALQDLTKTPESNLVHLDGPALSIESRPDSSLLWITLDVSGASEATPSIQVFRIAEGELQRADHPALEVVQTECSRDATDTDPYPNAQSLFPDTALLSKEHTQGNAEGGEEEDGQGRDGEDGSTLVEVAEE